MKKKVFLVIGIIVALIVGLITYWVIVDLKEEDKLKKELDEISIMANEPNIDVDKIFERLDRTITTGDYAKVERSFKNYLRDNFLNILDIASILEDERLVTLLTAENYLEDGKEFVESKKYIEDTRSKLKECKEEYNNFFTIDKAMSYLNQNELDSYYIDLYKDEFVGDIESANTDKTVENSIDDIINLLNISEQVIDLLRYNQSSWEIENGMIAFNDNNLANEYDNLISKLQ